MRKEIPEKTMERVKRKNKRCSRGKGAKMTEIEKKKGRLKEYAESKSEEERLKLELEALGEEKTEWTEEEKRMQQGIKEKIHMERTDNLKRFDMIRKAIGEMPEQRERDILTYRYLNGMKWGEIEEKMGYEHAQIMRIHRKALCNVKI